MIINILKLILGYKKIYCSAKKLLSLVFFLSNCPLLIQFLSQSMASRKTGSNETWKYFKLYRPFLKLSPTNIQSVILITENCPWNTLYSTQLPRAWFTLLADFPVCRGNNCIIWMTQSSSVVNEEWNFVWPLF